MWNPQNAMPKVAGLLRGSGEFAARLPADWIRI